MGVARASRQAGRVRLGNNRAMPCESGLAAVLRGTPPVLEPPPHDLYFLPEKAKQSTFALSFLN